MTFVVSLLLGVPLMVAGWRGPGAFAINLVVVLSACVPAWSMIAGAVGASAERKLTYSAALLLYSLGFDIIAHMTGWQAFATSATRIGDAKSATLVSVYQLLLISGPVVTLVLFAGKHPSVFWEARCD